VVTEVKADPAALRDAGWFFSDGRVERLWRPEELKDRDQSDRAAQQECHLISSVRLEAMITIAHYGGTTLYRPQRAIAMTVLFIVIIPSA
jgi:hypothetical protein